MRQRSVPPSDPACGVTCYSGSQCCGDVSWWAAAVQARRVVIDTGERGLPARHSHHRHAIAGPGGVQRLTVHLAGDTHNARTPISEVRISEHANWRRTHWGALYSAYGRTPYFDHAADDLRSIIFGSQTLLLDLNKQLANLVIDFMALPIELTYRDISSSLAAQATHTEGTQDHVDTFVHIKALPVATVAYHQLWADRHGFMPNLSILDLMMNEGREGILTLLKMSHTR